MFSEGGLVRGEIHELPCKFYGMFLLSCWTSCNRTWCFVVYVVYCISIIRLLWIFMHVSTVLLVYVVHTSCESLFIGYGLDYVVFCWFCFVLELWNCNPQTWHWKGLRVLLAPVVGFGAGPVLFQLVCVCSCINSLSFFPYFFPFQEKKGSIIEIGKPFCWIWKQGESRSFMNVLYKTEDCILNENKQQLLECKSIMFCKHLCTYLAVKKNLRPFYDFLLILNFLMDSVVTMDRLLFQLLPSSGFTCYFLTRHEN